MLTPIRLYRTNLKTGEQAPFPIRCIMCGRVVQAMEAIVDLEGVSVYAEPDGCKPDLTWSEPWAPPEEVDPDAPAGSVRGGK